MTRISKICLLFAALLVTINEFSAVALAESSVEVKKEIEPVAAHVMVVRDHKKQIIAKPCNRSAKVLSTTAYTFKQFTSHILSMDRPILFRSILT